ncbi:MAG: hypothetical protein ACLTK8_00725 [Paeniclostridium sp.]
MTTGEELVVRCAMK